MQLRETDPKGQTQVSTQSLHQALMGLTVSESSPRRLPIMSSDVSDHYHASWGRMVQEQTLCRCLMVPCAVNQHHPVG